jgi:hypothetical protein
MRQVAPPSALFRTIQWSTPAASFALPPTKRLPEASATPADAMAGCPVASWKTSNVVPVVCAGAGCALIRATAASAVSEIRVRMVMVFLFLQVRRWR